MFHEFTSEVVLKSSGIFENNGSNLLKHIGKIKLKDIFKHEFYLFISSNKIYIIPFGEIKNDEKEEKYEENKNNFSEALSPYFSNWIYKTTYYKVKFKPLLYSLNIDEKHFDLESEFSLDSLINIYSIESKPLEYYKLKNDLFHNIKIISHLLYKYELLDYINTFDKNISKECNNYDINNNIWW